MGGGSGVNWSALGGSFPAADPFLYAYQIGAQNWPFVVLNSLVTSKSQSQQERGHNFWTQNQPKILCRACGLRLPPRFFLITQLRKRFLA